MRCIIRGTIFFSCCRETQSLEDEKMEKRAMLQACLILQTLKKCVGLLQLWLRHGHSIRRW